MADNVTLDAGSGGSTIRTLEDGSSIQWPVGVCVYATTVGTPDVLQVVTPTAGLPVKQETGATFAVTQSGTWNIGTLTTLTSITNTVTVTGTGGTFPVTDSGGSLTVDAPVGTPVFVRLSDGSSAISTLPVSAASLPLPSGASTAANQSTANTALSAIQTAVELLDNTVSGSELQVDVVGALPAGTNAIGKLAANSGVDIGDVDVTSVTPGTTAAALGKAEDAAHSSGDVGVFVLGVRRDSPTSGADTDGDYCSFTFDSSGRIWTNVGNTVTVTGTVTAAQATAANLNCTEASAATIATNTGNSATSLAILDNIVSGSEAQVDIVASLPAGDNNIGNVDVVTMPNVTLAAGTNTNEVVGDAAHGAGVAGNPLLVGLEGRSTAPTAVDDGDVVRALATLLGKQVHIPYALPGSTWSYATANGGVTDTADDEAKAAVASTRNYVTSVQVINGHATTSTEVVIKDGSTVLWRGWAQAAGGGVAAKFDPPLRGTANTAINVANITNSSQTYFNLQGFVATE